MARWIAALGMIAGMALSADPAAAAGDGNPGPEGAWTVACEGDGPLRRCTVSTLQSFTDLKGEARRVSLSLLVDRACTTLHAAFETPIAADRPVDIRVDERQVQRFYTSDQLQALARAIDGAARPAAAPPEFARFLDDAKTGGMNGEAAGDEMIARFAAIKEPPVRRALPALREGRTLALTFHAPARTPRRVWHWPRLDERRVVIDLDGLALALDRAAASL